jgi:hypothetical protein
MADALSGFSPRLQAALRAAGVDFGVNSGWNSAASSGWGRFTPKDLANQRESQLLHQPVVSSAPTSPTVSALGANMASVGLAFNPNQINQQSDTIKRLYKQYVDSQGHGNDEEARAQLEGRSSAHRSIFSRIMSVLSRPGQAVEGFVLGNQAQVAGKPGEGNVLSQRLQDAAAGFTGHSHFSGAQALRSKGVNNKVVTGLGGFGIDAVLDPVSYLGAGVAKKAVFDPLAAKATFDAAKVAGPKADSLAFNLGADIASGTTVLPKRQLVARAQVGQKAIDQVANQIGVDAARTARAALETDLIKVGMPKGLAAKRARRWMDPGYAGTEAMIRNSQPWFEKIMASPDTLKSAVDTTVTKVAEQAAENTAKQLTELLHANLTQQVERSIKLRFAGVPVGRIPLPPGVQSALGQAAKVDMVGKTLGVFDKAFHTGTRFDNELTVVKARAAGVAQRRIEIGRQWITKAFTGVDLANRRAYMEALTTGPRESVGRDLVRNAAGEDVADHTASVLDHLGKYVDFKGDGSGLLSIDDLNRYLPGKKGPTSHGNYMKFDKRTITGVPEAVHAEGNAQGGLFEISPHLLTAPKPTQVRVQSMQDLIKANGDYLRHVDPAKFLYALHIAVEKGVARDQLGRAIREWGVEVNPKVLTRDPLTGRMQAGRPSVAAKELVDKHGYEPIHTSGHLQETSGFYGKHLDGLIFPPEVKKGLLRVIQIADHEEKRGELLRSFDRVQNMTKKLLTLPTPAFHIRNSFGDFMTGSLDGVIGPRGMASYQQAMRTMVGLKRAKEPFSETTPSPLTAALTAPVNPATGAQPSAVEALAGLLRNVPEAPGAGKRILKAPKNWPDAPGGYLTDAQIWAAYSHAGLNQGFVAGDLGQEVAMHNPDALAPTQALHTTMDKLMQASTARENFFRLAHFIDRVKRSSAPTLAKAAEEAAYYVRKFHFDYTDVTPFEQAVMARLLPFYKWTRFATPLMLQTFFAKPGAILNWQRVQAGISEAAGFPVDENMLPSADLILPQYFSDAAMYPLYTSSRGNNVYMNPGVPSTQIGNQTLGLSGDNPSEVGGSAFRSLVASSSPFLQAPFELATGHRVFGGGDIPTGPTGKYLLGRFGGPVPNLEMNSGKADFDTRLLSAFTGLGLSENTPGRQQAYIQDLLAQARAAKRKAGIQPSTGTTNRSRPSRPSRGGR